VLERERVCVCVCVSVRGRLELLLRHLVCFCLGLICFLFCLGLIFFFCLGLICFVLFGFNIFGFVEYVCFCLGLSCFCFCFCLTFVWVYLFCFWGVCILGFRVWCLVFFSGVRVWGSGFIVIEEEELLRV